MQAITKNRMGKLYSIEWAPSKNGKEQIDIAWRDGDTTHFLRYTANMVNHIAYTEELLIESGYNKIEKMPVQIPSKYQSPMDR